MTWRVVATIRCGVLLLQTGGELVVPEKTERHAYIQAIRLQQPRTIGRWRTTPASEYDVELNLNAADAGQAHQVGLACLREVVAALSFLGSAPVEIVKVQVITDSPRDGLRVEDPSGKVIGIRPAGSGPPQEPGAEYTSMVFPELFHEVPPAAVAMADTAFLGAWKPERVVRALRWIHKSYFTENPLDEFTCLMIAFESLSEMLAPAAVQYWYCSGCDQDTTQCPKCGRSTAWKMSGATAMREFVVQSLGWSANDWKTVWQLRCSLLHGEADISMDEEHAIQEHLPKLEEATIAAVKAVAGLPPDGPPTSVRHRVPFSDPYIELKYKPSQLTKNEPEGA